MNLLEKRIWKSSIRLDENIGGHIYTVTVLNVYINIAKFYLCMTNNQKATLIL